MTATHHVAGLSFDEARLEQRRKTLGASEVPSVAGLNPHRTALDVWLEKKNMVPAFAGNAHTEWGLRLEDAIATKYGEVMGVPLMRSESIVSDAWMSCTPDRLVVTETDHPGTVPQTPVRGLEIKRFGDYRADDFGVPGTGEVPLDVTAQCLWSMLVTGLRAWDLAVLLGQADFRIYHLEYDDDAAQALRDVGRAFWFDHVIANVQPALDGTDSAKRYLKQRFATHGPELLDATADLIDEARRLADLRDEQKHLEQQVAACENRLKAAIGESAGIRGIATWKLDRSGRPRWKDIAERLGATKPENADLVKSFTSAPTRRFLFTYKDEG